MSQSEPEKRPLPVRQRTDLIIVPTGDQLKPCWTVKDPLSLRYYQLELADHFVLQQLDGKTSLQQIQERFFRQYAPLQLEASQVLTFIHQLWNQGLVSVDRFGLSHRLLDRTLQLQKSERNQVWKNLLAIRFRGVDPDRWLTWMLPYVSWLFSPVAVGIGALLVFAAMVLVMTEWDLLRRELPRFQDFLQGQQLLVFLVAVAAVKIFHELGHAIACKRQGGECRELGVMLLALTPCLYCNVSDAWLLPKRRQRIAVSAAGMGVELVLAAICTFVWYITVPGLVHSLCLSIMVIGSVNTLLLNGNPLLRYDGYYVLSDLVRVPNLRSRAQQRVNALLARLFCGVVTPPPRDMTVAGRIGLTVYGIASAVYGWVVIGLILWMLYHLAKPYDLQAIVVAFGAALVMGRVVAGVHQTQKSLRIFHHEKRMNWGRFILAASVSAAVLFAVMTTSFPRQIVATGVVKGANLHPVYVTIPGLLEMPRSWKEGDSVTQGETLATLTNSELDQEIARLEGDVQRQFKQVELMEIRQVTDSSVASSLPAARASLEDLQQRLHRRQQDRQYLVLTAPMSGRLIAPDSMRSHADQPKSLLREEPPFKGVNQGAWLNAGDQFCFIADAGQQEVVFYLEQSEIPQLTIDQMVQLTTFQTTSARLSGKIIEIAAQPVERVPAALAASGSIPVKPGAQGEAEPLFPVHEVRVRLDSSPQDLVLEQQARGAISLGKESLWSRLVRWVQRTVKFDLT